MAQMKIPNILEEHVLQVLSENPDLTLPYILQLVDRSLEKNFKVHNLPKAVGAILSLGCRRGTIKLNRFGEYSLPNSVRKHVQENKLHQPVCNVLNTIQNNCHMKSRKRTMHNLDPNVGKRCVVSDESISGDELERLRKMLRTNTKRMKMNKMPIKLPQTHTYEDNSKNNKKFVEIEKTNGNTYVCYVKDELQPYDTLTVIHPESKKNCGKMIYLPNVEKVQKNGTKTVNMQNEAQMPEHFSRPAAAPPALPVQNQNINDDVPDAQLNLSTINSDHLKVPQFVSSQKNMEANARRNARRRAARAAAKAAKLKSMEMEDAAIK